MGREPSASPSPRQSPVEFAALCTGELRTLEPGQVYPAQITSGQRQCWAVHVPARHYMHIEVTQQGIDVVVQLFDRTNRTPVTEKIDSPNGRSGWEPLSQQTGQDPTDYVIVVSSTDDRPVQPNYQMAITEWRAGIAEDPDFVIAERDFLKGQLLYGTAILERTDAKKASNMYYQALEELQKALGGLSASEQRGRAMLTDIKRIKADIHVRLGWLKCATKDYQESIDQFSALRQLARADNGLDWEAYAVLLAKECSESSGQEAEARRFTTEFNSFELKARASALDRVGDFYWANEDYLKGIDLHQLAAQLYHEGALAEQEAIILTKIGRDYFDLGMFEQAAAQYEGRALKVPGTSNAVKANAKYNLAVVLGALGERSRAFTELSEAYELFPKEDVIARIYSLHTLGWHYIALGEHEVGRGLVKQALDLNKGLDANAAAYEYLYLGFSFMVDGNEEQGRKYTEQALKLWDALNDPRGKGNALYNLGKAAFDQGRLDTALQNLVDAERLQQNDPYGRAYSLTSLGSIYSKRGNLTLAREKFAEALELRGGNRQGRIETLTIWARAEASAGNAEKAETMVTEAISILEDLRKNVPGAELRAPFFASFVQVYSLRIDLLMQKYRTAGKTSDLEEALSLSDAIHARSLLDSLMARQPDSPRVPASGLLKEERELLDQWNQAVGRQKLLTISPHKPEQLAEAEREAIDVRTRWQRLRDKIDNDPEYRFLQPKLVSAPKMKSLVDSNTLMLQFLLGDERSYVWLISDKDIKGFQLPAREHVESVVRSFLKHFPKSDPRGQKSGGIVPRQYVPADFEKSATDLSQLLLGGLTGQLGSKRLVIVADGILHYVPFNALTNLESRTRKWQPLIISHEIVVSPSAAVSCVLHDIAVTRKAPTHSIAVIGDPIYQTNPPVGPEDPTIARAAALLGTPNIYLRFLGYEVDEIEKLQEKFVPKSGAQYFTRQNADLKNATRSDLSNFRILHYAAHGVFDDLKPETSGLLLSIFDQNNRPRSDNFLSLYHVNRMDLSADLVVLSACESALGKEVKGEGLMGLTRAFMRAGASRVISSLWVVNDARTARLMKEFYRQMWEEGLEPAAALREAQRSLFKDGEPPQMWAAFQMQGDWKSDREPVALCP